MTLYLLHVVSHRDTIMKEPLHYKQVWSKFSESEEEELVTVFLMQQLALGNESKWAPYINVRSYSCTC